MRKEQEQETQQELDLGEEKSSRQFGVLPYMKGVATPRQVSQSEMLWSVLGTLLRLQVNQDTCEQHAKSLVREGREIGPESTSSEKLTKDGH